MLFIFRIEVVGDLASRTELVRVRNKRKVFLSTLIVKTVTLLSIAYKNYPHVEAPVNYIIVNCIVKKVQLSKANDSLSLQITSFVAPLWLLIRGVLS
jgi:hypothetical protein